MMASEKSTPELPVLDKKNDDGIESEVSKVSSSIHGARGERIVTRKELWSYYCKFRIYLFVVLDLPGFLIIYPVYYNGGSVRRI